MAEYIVAVSDSRHGSYEIEREILRAAGAELVQFNCATAQDIVRELGDVDGILLDMAPMNAEAVAGLKKCRVINRYGVGYDNVDVAACTQKGIQATYVPDYYAEDGLDTHAAEPLPADSPYKALDNVVLTDHMAYSTVEGVAELKTKSAKNIVDVLQNRKTTYRVNML